MCDFAGLLIEECERLRAQLTLEGSAHEMALNQLEEAKAARQDSLAEALREAAKSRLTADGNKVVYLRVNSRGSWWLFPETREWITAFLGSDGEEKFDIHEAASAILAAIKPKPTAADARLELVNALGKLGDCPALCAAVERWEAEEKGGAE